VSTLVAVILTLFGIDSARPINCQVGRDACITALYSSLTGWNFKLWIIFTFVSKSQCTSVFGHKVLCNFSFCFFLDLWLLPITFRGFVIDRAPHVSASSPCSSITLGFPNQILIEPSSIAVWNNNKIVIVLTIGIWVVYLAFIVEGEAFSVFSADELETLTEFGTASAISRVKMSPVVFFSLRCAYNNCLQLHSAWTGGF
jgi:hypothetical protein